MAAANGKGIRPPQPVIWRNIRAIQQDGSFFCVARGLPTSAWRPDQSALESGSRSAVHQFNPPQRYGGACLELDGFCRQGIEACLHKCRRMTKFMGGCAGNLSGAATKLTCTRINLGKNCNRCHFLFMSCWVQRSPRPVGGAVLKRD